MEAIVRMVTNLHYYQYAFALQLVVTAELPAVDFLVEDPNVVVAEECSSDWYKEEHSGSTAPDSVASVTYSANAVPNYMIGWSDSERNAISLKHLQPAAMQEH